MITGNKKITIKTDSGIEMDAHTPIIISASRSTDIPAFYSDWFLNRLNKGYAVWTNPFNRQKSYISFKNTKVIVFWTKNPEPIIPHLKKLDEKGICYYFQFTLNDYEKENFEPNLPSLNDRIKTFKRLAKLIGEEKVIWRFDPLITNSTITSEELLKKIENIGKKIKGYTEKLVFSFVDINNYRKVKNNLKNTCEFNLLQKKEIAQSLAELHKVWNFGGWDIKIAACAEEIDLTQYGIEQNSCIDGELMKRIFSSNEDLIHYLNTTSSQKHIGQRKFCNCIKSKDIGMYNTCRHFCKYCYANISQKVVQNNIKRHCTDGESIIY